MANEQNLRPITTTKRARELGSMGGQVKSVNKKIAARLRELKKKGATDSFCRNLAEIMEDPEMSVLDIKLYLEQVKMKTTNAAQMVNLAQALIQLHKAQHGEKRIIESQNMNLNVNVDIIKFQQLLKSYDKPKVVKRRKRKKK